MDTEKIKVSAVLIVKNEAERIAKCLVSIKPAVDEIIVVDTGSTDSTVDIAREQGALVSFFQWNGNFSDARNFGINQAKGEFVIWFDADDILPIESITPLKTLADADPSAWTVIVDNLFENRKGQSFRQLRLFPNGRSIAFEGRVHETLGPSVARAAVSIRHSSVRILHTGYNLESERIAKRDRNHELLKFELLDHPNDPVVLMEMGNSHHQRGEYSEAVACYKKISGGCAVNPAQLDVFRSVHSLIGVSLLASGDLNGAEEAFRHSISQYPDNCSAYYYMAEIAIKKNDVETLLGMCNSLISLPETIGTVACDYTGMVAKAYGWAANIYLIRGDAKRAAKLFAESEARNLPAAFTLDAAIEAAQKADDSKLLAYFKAKKQS